jgi:hypothetical protein
VVVESGGVYRIPVFQILEQKETLTSGSGCSSLLIVLVVCRQELPIPVRETFMFGGLFSPPGYG